jgi:undecaprenyl-diphosphatase
MKTLATTGPALLVLLVALLFLVPWRSRAIERRTGAVTGTIAAAVALGVNQPIAHAVDRARPYLAHPAHAHLLIVRSHDPSFPSDHATGGFALALGVLAFDRAAGIALTVLAALLSFARVFVGTHYPGDVAGGALIAAVVVLALVLPPLRAWVERLGTACSRAYERLIRRMPTRQRSNKLP